MGSSSKGPMNILKGVNDVCMGTAGGGSIHAPVLATNSCLRASRLFRAWN